MEEPVSRKHNRRVMCPLCRSPQVESALDTRSYQKGIKVSKAAMKCLDITGDHFHPEWNYAIRPRQTAKL